MLSTESVALTGRQNVDGLLSGNKWASLNITVGMPAFASFYSYGGERDSGFRGVSAVQSDAILKILGQFSAITNLNFIQSDSLSQPADIRFAATALTSTAWAYEPSATAEGGDIWFNSTGSLFTRPVAGSYGYMALLHETGHALGLKHGNETNVYGALPASRNSMEFSVMTYASYIGASTAYGFKNGATSYAQALMMDDIAALQTMYGADFTTQGGNTVYRWNPLTGEQFINGAAQGLPAGNQIFMTVWDGGGTDTYDFSNYRTNLSVNLNPGEWSTVSASQLARLSGDGLHLARGNIANSLQFKDDPRSLIENAIGGSGNDTITGNAIGNGLTGGAGNDVLSGGAGNDTLIGGAGADKLIGGVGYDTISYASATAAVALNLAVAGSGGEALGDTFAGIERILGSAFADVITGGALADRIEGSGGNDILSGSGGNDSLVGGRGADRLTGGAGSDNFVFMSALDGGDRLVDFQRGIDKLSVSAAGFGFTTATGAFDAGMLEIGARATTNHSEFFFNTATRSLWWDGDGRGAAAAVHVATIPTASFLSASDFLIV